MLLLALGFVTRRFHTSCQSVQGTSRSVALIEPACSGGPSHLFTIPCGLLESTCVPFDCVGCLLEVSSSSFYQAAPRVNRIGH
uniref:Uncharacterized protein n=1 Tax=Anopheles aquasalis TaxID=42839 RepID=T1E7K0_ANOAQ